MKRSEMVKKLKSYLYLIRTDTDENAQYVAELALTLCEKAGMLPPFVESPFDRSLGESTHDIKNYKWEKE